MIYITGDTHGTQNNQKIFLFHKKNLLTEQDFLIICGDFGAVWNDPKKDNIILDKYAELPFKILVVDGNHENFDALNQYPVKEWNGGLVHQIRNNVLHLMRGHIFTIENKTFFVMGGAESVDKEWRLSLELEQKAYLKKGESVKKLWWSEEIPNEQEILTGKRNLEAYDNKVDYILTHTHSNILIENELFFKKNNNPLNLFLDDVLKNIDYLHWFCGHFHLDKECKRYKTTILYDAIISISDYNKHLPLEK